MKKSGKAKKNRNPLAILVICVLIAVVGFQMVRVYGDIREKRAEKASCSTQLENTLQDNASMQADLDRADDPEIYKEKARKQWGWVEEGQRDFLDVNN